MYILDNYFNLSKATEGDEDALSKEDMVKAINEMIDERVKFRQKKIELIKKLEKEIEESREESIKLVQVRFDLEAGLK